MGSTGWTMLRRVVLPRTATDVVACLETPIDGPGKPERRRRKLHVDAEGLAALVSVEFKRFDAPPVVNMTERRVITERTWIYASLSDDKSSVVVSIHAQLDQLFMEIISSNRFQCFWRLCMNAPRVVSEERLLGVNSVDVDGAGKAASPTGFKLPLLHHQRSSLAWMAMRESCRELCASDHSCDHRFDCASVDLRLELKVEETFSLQGGLLCDVVGSGKTATVLALICQSRDRTRIPAHMRFAKGEFTTRATLVLCPANVHEQWLMEVAKFCPDALKVTPLRTRADLKNISATDLSSSDLVVAPYEMFALGDSSDPAQGDAFARLEARISEMDLHGSSELTLRTWDPVGTRKPSREIALDKLCWHRLVIDEFHEFCSERKSEASTGSARSRQIRNAIRTLEVGRRWGLSGTPDSFLNSSESVMHAASYFQCNLNARTAATFVEYYCRQARVAIPVELHDHVVRVTQTPAEQAMYIQQLSECRLPRTIDWSQIVTGGAKVERLLMLCSHFSPTGNTFDAEKTLTAEEVCERTLRRKRDAVTAARKQVLDVISSSAFLDLGKAAEGILQASGGAYAARKQSLQFIQPMSESWQPQAEALDSQVGCLQRAWDIVQDFDVKNEQLLVTLSDTLELCAGIDEAVTSLADFLPDSLQALCLNIRALVEQLRNGCKPALEAERALGFFKRTWEALSGQTGGAECPVCLEEVDVFTTYVLFCGHTLCMDCIPQLKDKSCPVCRLEIADLPGRGVRLHSMEPTIIPPRKPAQNMDPTRAHWSTKLRLFVETFEIIQIREPDAKVIVFSQWDNLRRHVSRALTDVEVRHLVLEGDIYDRTRILSEFRADSGISLLLLSLEDSASGTNLTVASHVVLLHPMLASSRAEASSYEAQAVGRVRRMGQTRPVHVWRFVTSRTVEEELWDMSAVG